MEPCQYGVLWIKKHVIWFMTFNLPFWFVTHFFLTLIILRHPILKTNKEPENSGLYSQKQILAQNLLYHFHICKNSREREVDKEGQEIIRDFKCLI